MSKTPNRAAICQVLMDTAKEDKDIVVFCSDSKGSASLTPSMNVSPEQLVEVGTAEQNLMSISAGLTKCGKHPFTASPICLLPIRGYEQVKVDVTYSNTNVELIRIGGGVSYGAPDISYHSCQGIAGVPAIPNMKIYIPSDRHQAVCLIKELTKGDRPAYIWVGRNPVEGTHEKENVPFQMDQAMVLSEGTDIAIIACGEMAVPTKKAAKLLKDEGKTVTLLDMCHVKPIDAEVVIRATRQCCGMITVEEHPSYGGLGAMVSQIMSTNCPKRVINMLLPDAPVVIGTSGEMFDYYGLDPEGIARQVLGLLKD